MIGRDFRAGPYAIRNWDWNGLGFERQNSLVTWM